MRRSLRSDEAGATEIEYGVLAAIVALAIVIGASAIGDSLATVFEGVGETLDGATTPGPTPTP
jgi:pilus assembly protein Flp/PilA